MSENNRTETSGCLIAPVDLAVSGLNPVTRTYKVAALAVAISGNCSAVLGI